ncbi:MAG: NAD(P)-dependent oxidoreductase [Parcubacteria group bacterium]|nr:NAD(P)-dependent oxidoreductase [Parcubacteria group bacterium]
MRVVILGSTGLLGSALTDVFSKSSCDTIGLSHNEAEITDFLGLKTKLLKLEPDYVINAAGYTDAGACETSQDLACQINGYAVQGLAEICADLGSVLIHYSGDCVFGKIAEYTESSSALRPKDAYGYSKALGEAGIAKIYKLTQPPLKYYVIRTSWLFGENGDNFVADVIRLGESSAGEVPILINTLGKPTYTYDLARRTLDLINWQAACGIYHITNEGDCSPYGLASAIFKIKKWDTSRLVPVTRQEMPNNAASYPYPTTPLINTKLPPLRRWEDALKDYLL